MTRIDALLSSSDRQHVMLLYDDESTRHAAEIDCINKGLTAGSFCVYACVDLHDKAAAAKFASEIAEYDRHLKEGNLVVVDFKPYYDSALKGNLGLFEQLKAKVEGDLNKRISEGKSKKALLVADAACNLTKNHYFGESARLETWWQFTYQDWMKRNLDITIICAHPTHILEEHSHIRDTSGISDAHSVTLDLRDFDARPKSPSSARKLIRIVVAESEPDMQAVYKWAFANLPVEATIVKNAEQCSHVLESSDKAFDVAIVDTHLADMPGVSLAKKIGNGNLASRVIITTTKDKNSVISEMASEFSDIGGRTAILSKPFEFTELLRLIKPSRR